MQLTVYFIATLAALGMASPLAAPKQSDGIYKRDARPIENADRGGIPWKKREFLAKRDQDGIPWKKRESLAKRDRDGIPW